MNPDEQDAQGYEGVTHAGLAIVAADTGRVLLAQRAPDATDAADVAETFEFPGGSLMEGEEPEAAAMREFAEEVGSTQMSGEVVDGWRSDNYQGFVVRVPREFSLEEWTPTAEVQALAWLNQEELDSFEGTLRPEIVASMDWSLVWGAVSGNAEPEQDVLSSQDMTDEEWALASESLENDPMLDEPDDLELGDTMMVHGVIAPENTASGDSRGFNDGALTSRPLRLPFSWQKFTAGGHDQSSVVGSIDRLMRRDGMIHWEGSLADTPETDEFVALLAHFGQYGVSIDGDNGSLDEARSNDEGMTWFDAVRISGVTAVSMPAFAEAYVAFGPHPDMPEGSSEDGSVLVAGMSMESFKRGPGWAKNPEATRRLHDYWTKKGQPGYAKIRWGTPGDFTRAKALIGEKIAKNSPTKMKYLNQIIAQWHHDALGYWPGELGKPGNAPNTPENRRRAAIHADGATTEFAETDPAVEDPAWEVVLTSSATGERVLPPASYFTEHPDSGALVIEPPDANGIRRTYGYAGQWGVCHVGYDGRCVEVPSDASGEYQDFHLGRTRISGSDTGSDYLSTGLITYNIEHRGAEQILSETPQQNHFDNLQNAWAAVRLGENEQGVWFSGVVLPGVDEDDLVRIEASGQVSGEWKRGSLRALLTVNVPGFPVIRSSAAFDDQGEVVALAASAFASVDNGTEGSPCDTPESPDQIDDPVGEVAAAVMERIFAKGKMQHLAEDDAAQRFAALKNEWVN